jgi:hypothetical protein
MVENNPEPPYFEIKEGVEIVGDVAFVAWTSEALKLLELESPEHYALVQLHLREVLQSSERTETDPESGVCSITELTAHAPGWEVVDQLAWFASVLVHEAHHVMLYRKGKVYYGAEGEPSCLGEQVWLSCTFSGSPRELRRLA